MIIRVGSLRLSLYSLAIDNRDVRAINCLAALVTFSSSGTSAQGLQLVSHFYRFSSIFSRSSRSRPHFTCQCG